MAETRTASSFQRVFDRALLARVADWLAVGVAASLPWSVSVSQILTVLWLVALVPTLDIPLVRRTLREPAAALPVALWLLALVGMLWADASWHDRFWGLDGFHKLLVIPLLLAQFRRSERGIYVVYGFFFSCIAMLFASSGLRVLWTWWSVTVPGKLPGLLVRDYIAQSSEFLICAIVLFGLAAERWRANAKLAAAAVLLALIFLGNIFYVAPGRTALAILPLLLVLFGFRYFGWKGVLAAIVAAGVLAAAAWAASPLLRARMIASIEETEAYQTKNTVSSTGIRLELWKKSLAMMADAPIIGHGTGSIPEQFRRRAIGEGVSGLPSVNPHNQIFAVGIQVGALGIVLLLMMWVAHLGLFCGNGVIAWAGIVMVVQNFASAPVNSHLFDSFHGWLYVFGLGVLGGIALRERDRQA